MDVSSLTMKINNIQAFLTQCGCSPKSSCERKLKSSISRPKFFYRIRNKVCTSREAVSNIWQLFSSLKTSKCMSCNISGNKQTCKKLTFLGEFVVSLTLELHFSWPSFPKLQKLIARLLVPKLLYPVFKWSDGSLWYVSEMKLRE